MHPVAPYIGDLARVAALHNTHLLDSTPEEAFDRLTRLATHLLRVPVALVSLVDVERQFFKSQVGLPEPWTQGTPLSHSFCQHTVASAAPLVVEDARLLPLVQDNLAIPDLDVIAYAGIPLITADGHALGSFCVIDHQPRTWTTAELAILNDLATAVMTEIELRTKVRAYEVTTQQLAYANNDLEARVVQYAADLQSTHLQLEQQIAKQQRTANAIRDLEAGLHAVMKTATDAIVLVNSTNTITLWNPAAERIFGYSSDEAIGQSITLIMDPAYRDLYTDGLQRARVTEGTGITDQIQEMQGVRKDGTTFPVELSVSMWQVRTEIYFSSIIRDITARKHIEQDLRRSERELRGLFDNAHDAIIILDPDTEVVLEANHQAIVMYGYAREEFIGLSLKTISQNVERGRALVAQITAGHPATRVETVQFRKDGSAMSLEINASLVQYQDRPAILSVNRDITERKVFEAKLTYMAFYDSLTGLPNRAWLMDRLAQVLGDTHRPDQYIALLFVDLDRFKAINDSLGHHVGDEALIFMAQFLQTQVRSQDCLVRLGGDEFVILLSQLTDANDAIAVADRIVQQATDYEFLIGEHRIYSTMSVGVALSHPGAQEATAFLRDAGNALTRAKAKGKARVEVFDHNMTAQALARLELEQDLRQALTHNELHVYYQPIFTLDEHRITKVEALIRWHHPVRGVVPPAEFIPIAEEIGLIISIDSWVLAQACAQVQAWNATERFPGPLRLAVNLSARQFQHANLITSITSTLRATGLPPHNLTLEITESVAMIDPEFTAATLVQLKQLGVQIAIDDFGTGYSSLSYLKRFPLDTLKIDKSFVAGLPHDTEDTAIVRAIITLAESLHMKVIAEGIETNAQCQELRALGCPLGQGFYFARPLPAAALAERFFNQWLPEYDL